MVIPLAVRYESVSLYLAKLISGVCLQKPTSMGHYESASLYLAKLILMWNLPSKTNFYGAYVKNFFSFTIHQIKEDSNPALTWIFWPQRSKVIPNNVRPLCPQTVVFQVTTTREGSKRLKSIPPKRHIMDNRDYQTYLYKYINMNFTCLGYECILMLLPKIPVSLSQLTRPFLDIRAL